MKQIHLSIETFRLLERRAFNGGFAGGAIIEDAGVLVNVEDDVFDRLRALHPTDMNEALRVAMNGVGNA